jgi:hypothetical protein
VIVDIPLSWNNNALTGRQFSMVARDLDGSTADTCP